MDRTQILQALLTVKIVSADPETLIRQLTGQGIALYSISNVEDLAFTAKIQKKDLDMLTRVTERRGESLQILQRRGSYWWFVDALKRPVLLAAFLLLLALTLLLPTRILFIRVAGNEQIPANRILEQARASGLDFFCSREALRSEQVKNRLLEEIPQLKWVGINTAGCVATVSVREAPFAQVPEDTAGVSSIVAIRDGVIVSAVVTRGNLLCTPGQEVQAGDILVSGYSDFGIATQATRSNAEIFACTRHDLLALFPDATAHSREILRQETKYSLIFGKKKINFYNDGSNLDTSCGKMYEISFLTLPGGFQLPVALEKEIRIYYDTGKMPAAIQRDQAAIRTFAYEYLQSQMIAGEILTQQVVVEPMDGGLVLTGQYICREMIGREQNEEIGYQYGKNN